MKINNNTLPGPLKDFMKNGRAVFRGDDGDWDVKIESIADTPYKNDIPAAALIIANNGCGDCLFMRKLKPDSTAYEPEVYVYWHEEHRHEIYSENINNLTNPEPAKPSKHIPIFYCGGTIEVQLGDEVSTRVFLFRKNGRITYLPGVSKKNRNMENGGLSWVGIKCQRGPFIGTIVDPETFQLKKKIRFLQRSVESIKELGPDEDLE
jgi:hypothetical protein